MKAMQISKSKLICPECGSKNVKLWKNEIICLDCGTIIEEILDCSGEE